MGSRLGNSLLVRFTDEQDTVITIDDSDILGKEKERGMSPNQLLISPENNNFSIRRSEQASGGGAGSVWQRIEDIRSIDELHI